MFTYNGVRAGLFGTLRNILTFRKVDRMIAKNAPSTYPANIKGVAHGFTALDMTGDFV